MQHAPLCTQPPPPHPPDTGEFLLESAQRRIHPFSLINKVREPHSFPFSPVSPGLPVLAYLSPVIIIFPLPFFHTSADQDECLYFLSHMQHVCLFFISLHIFSPSLCSRSVGGGKKQSEEKGKWYI